MTLINCFNLFIRKEKRYKNVIFKYPLKNTIYTFKCYFFPFIKSNLTTAIIANTNSIMEDIAPTYAPTT